MAGGHLPQGLQKLQAREVIALDGGRQLLDYLRRFGLGVDQSWPDLLEFGVGEGGVREGRALGGVEGLAADVHAEGSVFLLANLVS